MNSNLKKWVGLGLATAFVGTSLTACGSNDVEEADDASMASQMDEGEGADGENGEGEGGEASHDMETLPLENRLAFMSGHVATGLALYRAGEPEMAAPHLLHPVSETHADERTGIDALGFDGSLFEAVSAALEGGVAASEVEEQLLAAEANLKSVAEAAGGDPASIINFLMDTVLEEYAVGVTDGVVTDAGEYQDAFGFATVALERADAFDAETAAAVKAEIETLLTSWPEGGPVPPEEASPVGQVSALTSRVQLALPLE